MYLNRHIHNNLNQRQPKKGTQTMEETELLTKKQVAELLHCSTSCVDQMRRKKGLPHFKVGILVRFRPADVQSWIEARTVVRIPVNTEMEESPLTCRFNVKTHPKCLRMRFSNVTKVNF